MPEDFWGGEPLADLDPETFEIVLAIRETFIDMVFGLLKLHGLDPLEASTDVIWSSFQLVHAFIHNPGAVVD